MIAHCARIGHGIDAEGRTSIVLYWWEDGQLHSQVAFARPSDVESKCDGEVRWHKTRRQAVDAARGDGEL
jgi:hypothetical protein